MMDKPKKRSASISSAGEHVKKLMTKAIWLLITIFVIVSFPTIAASGCQIQQTQSIPQPTVTVQPKPVQPVQFKRSTSTAPNVGAPSVIFRMDDVAKGQYEDITDRIIRIFAKNNAPLDIGVIPHANGQNSFEIPFLRTYLDAGIIDITMHGNQHTASEFDTAHSNQKYDVLKADLIRARSQFTEYFGFAPVAFTIPYDFFSEDGYKAVQDAGFKIFSTQKAAEPFPSVQPVDFAGKQDLNNGMSRLCTVIDVAKWDATTRQWGDIFSTDLKNELFASIDWGLKNLGVAVVGIHPQAFLKSDGSADQDKLNKLDAIVKAVRQRNSITTFESWYKFATTALIMPAHIKTGKTPAFNGGPAVIMRLDDVERGVLEDTVEEIIKVFQRNGVPLDVGVMPFGGGRISYNVPFLWKYLDAGVIDISVHGYRNTFAEFNTDISGASLDTLDPAIQRCFENVFGQFIYTPYKTYYEDLRDGLILARQRYAHYFGIWPMTFTVPNDYFNYDGYKAVQDAGFKIFSSQELTETYPSGIMTVDYNGKEDPNGMYRLPAFASIQSWDTLHCTFGDLLTLADPDDYLYDSMIYGIKSNAGIAVIYLHPQGFTDSREKPDPVKLQKLDAILKFIIDHRDIFGPLITFQSWYEWRTANPPAVVNK